MISTCYAVVAWLASFIGRLVSESPFRVLSSISVSLSSQVFQIVAFLLPLKVMILLGSPSVPSYFPQFLMGFERERLILMLAAASVLLYLMHLLMDFIGAKLARSGSKCLIFQPRDGVQLLRQIKLALSFYRGVITLASGSLFALGVVLFLGVFNSLLLLVVVGYSVMTFLVCTLVFSLSPALLAKSVGPLPRIIDIWSGCGFLLVFGCLVMGFLYGESEGLLMAILTLLLCRQMFSRLAMAFKSAHRLYSQREKAFQVFGGFSPESTKDADEEEDDENENENENDVLLNDLNNQHDKHRTALKVADEPEPDSPVNTGLQPLVRPAIETELGVDVPSVIEPAAVGIADTAQVLETISLNFWEVIDPEFCLPWIHEALTAVGVVSRDLHIEQVDTFRKGEYALHLTCTQYEGEGGREHFLFKVFARRGTVAASRASALLEQYDIGAAVKLLKIIEREGFVAHLYEWSEQVHQAKAIDSLYVCRAQVFSECSVWSVPDNLKDISYPTLSSRCDAKLWARCQAFSRWLDPKTRQLVDSFAADSMRLQRALECLPLRVYNPDITLADTYILGSIPKALRWENWTLEPIGSGWPLELGLEKLDQVFAQVSEKNQELYALSIFQVRLAALAFAFEAHCARRAYLDAFSLLAELDSTLSILD